MTRNNFEEALRTISDLVGSTSFISIDEEMTGISLPGKKYGYSLTDSPEVRYSKMREVVMKYSMIQFGMCLFHQDREDPTTFVARPFNFFVFPVAAGSGDDRAGPLITLEVGAVEFNHKHNMNWNKWIGEGIAYVNAQDENDLRKRARMEEQRGRELNPALPRAGMNAKTHTNRQSTGANATASTSGSSGNDGSEEEKKSGTGTEEKVEKKEYQKKPIVLNKEEDKVFVEQVMKDVEAWTASVTAAVHNRVLAAAIARFVSTPAEATTSSSSSSSSTSTSSSRGRGRTRRPSDEGENKPVESAGEDQTTASSSPSEPEANPFVYTVPQCNSFLRAAIIERLKQLPPLPCWNPTKKDTADIVSAVLKARKEAAKKEAAAKKQAKSRVSKAKAEAAVEIRSRRQTSSGSRTRGMRTRSQSRPRMDSEVEESDNESTRSRHGVDDTDGEEEEDIDEDDLNEFVTKMLREEARHMFISNIPGKDRWAMVLSTIAMTRAERMEREAKEAEARQSKVDSALGLRRLFTLIANKGIPLVGHNCLYDLMFMMQAFDGPLPESLDEFRKNLHKCFPKIYDTKYIFGTDAYKASPASFDSENTHLGGLYTSFSQWKEKKQASSGDATNTATSTSEASSSTTSSTSSSSSPTSSSEPPRVRKQDAPGFVYKGPSNVILPPGFDTYNTDQSRFHEAAFDAYCTGVVFINEAMALAHDRKVEDLEFLCAIGPVEAVENTLFMMKSLTFFSVDPQIPHRSFKSMEPNRSAIVITQFTKDSVTGDFLSYFEKVNPRIQWIDDVSLILFVDSSMENAAMQLVASHPVWKGQRMVEFLDAVDDAKATAAANAAAAKSSSSSSSGAVTGKTVESATPIGSKRKFFETVRDFALGATLGAGVVAYCLMR